MEFREALSSDVDAVSSLYKSASEGPFSVWNADYPSRLEAVEDQKTNNLFVLTDRDAIIGCISIVPNSEMEDMDVWQFPNESHREIARIAIAPSYQGQGLAAQLVQSIFEVLLSRGYQSVRLSAACCNLPACKTYSKLGFQIRGEAELYGNHYYLMEKEL